MCARGKRSAASFAPRSTVKDIRRDTRNRSNSRANYRRCTRNRVIDARIRDRRAIGKADRCSVRPCVNPRTETVQKCNETSWRFRVQSTRDRPIASPCVIRIIDTERAKFRSRDNRLHPPACSYSRLIYRIGWASWARRFCRKNNDLVTFLVFIRMPMRRGIKRGIHLSASHVRRKISMRRTARALGQSEIGSGTSRWCSRPCPLVESKRNKRATRACMQNNAPRRARPPPPLPPPPPPPPPPPCRNPSPEQIDRSIHFGAAAESSHPRAWNSAERLNFTAGSRGKPEWRPGKERTKAVKRGRRGKGLGGVVSLRVRSSGTPAALGILDIWSWDRKYRMRKIAAERSRRGGWRGEGRTVAGGSGTRVGAEGADGRKIVANDGEVKAASSSSLPAFVLLGVPAWRRYMYRRIAEGTRGGGTGVRNLSFCWKLREELIKMGQVARLRGVDKWRSFVSRFVRRAVMPASLAAN